MDLKPTGKRGWPKGRTDQRSGPAPSANPWEAIGKNVGSPTSNKRRRPFADTLGATPPRDGPFAAGAADIAVQKPPKTRKARNTSAGGANPWLLVQD